MQIHTMDHENKGVLWYLKHFKPYRRGFKALKKAKFWLFLVPPLKNTSHFSVIAAINPILCTPRATISSTDGKPCFIGMDSFHNIHGQLHINLINTYLRR